MFSCFLHHKHHQPAVRQHPPYHDVSQSDSNRSCIFDRTRSSDLLRAYAPFLSLVSLVDVIVAVVLIGVCCCPLSLCFSSSIQPPNPISKLELLTKTPSESVLL
ncbi:hypothetical protein TWF718_005168 [Orbilia javanica]|uniref:Transmembrane protein n=1 Tax=Orbilia javanica TaxID=47235 RepID=A0AAN8MYW2_9PEZI